MCHRCRRYFHSHDSAATRPTTRSSVSSSSSAPGVNNSSTSSSESSGSSQGPWRCILETCNAFACLACADYVQSELSSLQTRILAAKDRGEEIDTESAIKEIEKPPPRQKKRPGTGGSKPATGDGCGSLKVSERGALKARLGTGVEDMGAGNEDWGLGVTNGSEALEADDTEKEEEDDDDDDDELPVMVFRTAAMAAAAARLKVKNPPPRVGMMVGRREGKAAM